MIKKVVLFIICMLIASCSTNYAEDESYAHIKKTDVVCKPIKVEQFDIYKSSNVNVVTTSKCLFLKKESVTVSPHAIKEREKLEAMLEVNDEKTLPNQNPVE